MDEENATDQAIQKLRLAGFRLEEIGRLIEPPVTRQRIWERLHRNDPKRLARRQRERERKAKRRTGL